MDCQSRSGPPRLGPPRGNRGLLVKHDVPLGKIRAAAVAWECALGLYTKNAVTLHQGRVMDKLDWRVRVSENTHLCQTHLCRRMLVCVVDASESGLLHSAV